MVLQFIIGNFVLFDNIFNQLYQGQYDHNIISNVLFTITIFCLPTQYTYFIVMNYFILFFIIIINDLIFLLSI